jgi:endogenous inhibitor of DNA gyrase (YacG/DUF329 family)
MSNNRIEITCSRCGHTWYEDLARLDKADQDIYKGKMHNIREKTYRVPCPQCGTNNVVTVRFEE